MTSLMREIEKLAKSLSVEERELLAERLLATVSEAPLTDLDILWLEEAERRYPLWSQDGLRGLPQSMRWQISGENCASESGTRSVGKRENARRRAFFMWVAGMGWDRNSSTRSSLL
ncbi:MAG: addiction module protein [Syntrophobacteraceae bacterium]|jgi:hypothetical protein